MALPFRGNSGGGGRFNPRFQRQQEPEHRINERIRVPQVRLVGDNITVGVYSTQEALKIAQSLELDLVEISPQADPPVCKAIDYKKFLYEKKRKEKEMKAIVNELLEAKLIRKSKSSWAARAFLVPKKNSTQKRMVINTFR